MTFAARALPAIAMICVAGSSAAQERFDEATGYRIAAYRGVVPAPPPGVPRVAADEVATLVDAGGAILIDVAPAEAGVRGVDGRWRLTREQHSIAGATWFPEAGRGRIDPAVERWFVDGVRRLRAERPKATLILFCLADCWMSWNASLRLHRAGLRDVRWFAEGADGWRDLGRPLTPITPAEEHP